MIDSGPRSASATAAEATELFVLQRRHVLQFLKQNPTIALKLLEGMAALVRDITHQLGDHVFLPIPSRLAKLLIALSAESGKESSP